MALGSSRKNFLYNQRYINKIDLGGLLSVLEVGLAS
jgi:hypothetical protein